MQIPTKTKTIPQGIRHTDDFEKRTAHRISELVAEEMTRTGPEPRALRSYETVKAQLLCACSAIFENPETEKTLYARLHDFGMLKRFRMIRTLMTHLTDELMDSMPLEKRLGFAENIERSQIVIESVNRPKPKDPYMWVKKSDLMDLAEAAARDHCTICEGMKCDMKDCQFRRAMRRMMTFDMQLPEGTWCDCEWKYFDWNLMDDTPMKEGSAHE